MGGWAEGGEAVTVELGLGAGTSRPFPLGPQPPGVVETAANPQYALAQMVGGDVSPPSPTAVLFAKGGSGVRAGGGGRR